MIKKLIKYLRRKIEVRRNWNEKMSEPLKIRIVSKS